MNLRWNLWTSGIWQRMTADARRFSTTFVAKAERHSTTEASQNRPMNIGVASQSERWISPLPFGEPTSVAQPRLPG
jgi:hypothetical protein